MTSDGFSSQCTSCGKVGVRIARKVECSKCHRVNRYCMGCAASEVNGLRKLGCMCQWKQRKKRKTPLT